MAKCGCGSCSCTVEPKEGEASYCSPSCCSDCGGTRTCECGHPECKP